MLTAYNKYLNDEILNETHVKPDPPGAKAIYNTMSFKNDFDAIQKKAIEEARKNAAVDMAKKFKDNLKGAHISVKDENGRNKILFVNDVAVEKAGDNYILIIIEDKDKKVKYYWFDNNISKIFRIDKFLQFFEKNYLGQLILFQGKPVKGGNEMRYTKEVTRIGTHEGPRDDNVIVLSDDDTQQFLMFEKPIKILDKKVKALDPYGEENWEE